MLSTLAEVPGLQTFVITRDPAFIYKKQNENNPQKKSYICGSEVGKICSVYPKTEGKWKQQKCIFFLWFRYSHPERHFQIAQEPYGRAKEGIQVLITPHFTLTRNC